MAENYSVPPTDKYLKEAVRNYYRDCKPKAMREMRKLGEWDELVELTLEATKRAAQRLVHQGVMESQAWSWAIRQEILGREPD